MATQMQPQGFIWKEITWPPELLERKNNNKVVSFRALFFMFTLRWITGKSQSELLKTKETNFVGRKTWKFKAAVRK